MPTPDSKPGTPSGLYLELSNCPPTSMIQSCLCPTTPVFPALLPQLPAHSSSSRLFSPSPSSWKPSIAGPPVLLLHLLNRVPTPMSEVAQSCPTLCGPTDCSPPGSSLHGILQATILEWVAISFSRGSSRLRDQTRVSCVAGRRFNL